MSIRAGMLSLVFGSYGLFNGELLVLVCLFACLLVYLFVYLFVYLLVYLLLVNNCKQSKIKC